MKPLSKISALLALFASGTLCLANQVTYEVNLSVQRALGNFNPANGDTAVVSGTFSLIDWVTTNTLQPSLADTNIYVGTFSNNVAPGNVENHKFIINPGGNSPAGLLIWESGNNRGFTVTTDDQLVTTVYFDNVSPATTVITQVTFRVNMEGQIAEGTFNPATDTVSVSSDVLNNWSTTASPLTNSPLQPHLWRNTFTVTNNFASPVKYKFIKHTVSSGDIAENNFGSSSVTNRQYITGNSPQILPLVDFNNKSVPMEFWAGADMSHLVFFENRGIAYRSNNVPQDALTLLKSRGINVVRLRLFTSSAAQAQANPYDYTNNLSYTIPLAVRVKNAGLKFLLDYHYSDTWADPGKQTKPDAWTNLNFTQLKAEVRSYTSNTIAAFNAAGAMPDYVQIGNEITPGMLWNDGRVGGSFDNSTQWSQLAQLLASAFQGIKDVAGSQMPKVMVHIDRGGNWEATRWYYDHIEAEQVPFDLIGESYYPWWHGSPTDLQLCLNNAGARYGRPIVVVETGFPWGNSTNLFGIPATPAGQVQFVTTLAQIVKGVPGGKGVGIVWWAAEYQSVPGYNLAGFERRSFFGITGGVPFNQALPVIAAFGLLTAPMAITHTRTGSNLKLSWPLSGAAMHLTSATNLSPSTIWSNVTNTVSVTNGIFSVTLPVTTEPANLFRLQSN